jgi:Flp pilus assembly protein TadG
MSKQQRGVTTVEFAIVGLLAMITLFGVLEIARAFFVYNTLGEATRRGARVAAVCQVNDPAIREITIFRQAGGGSTSTILSGLTTANVIVEYLDNAGNLLADPMASYGLIRYVRVRISRTNS